MFYSGEFEMACGEFIALSPKCYFTLADDGGTKIGTKGLPHSAKVTLNDFRNCLKDGTPYNVELQTLTKKNNQMSRVKQVKAGLSRIFYKFPIADDGITCSPLKENDVYL